MTISYNRLGSNGRLGNQMFQYAGLRGIAAHRGFDWTVPEPITYGDSNYGLFDCFKMSSVKEENFGLIQGESLQTGCFHFNQDAYDKWPDATNLHDYFQTEKYFKNVEDIIRKDFTFQNDIMAPCLEVMNEYEDPIFIHVRRGDYVKNENNDLEKINSLKKFCEIELGKGAIVCNDTPGFLGNRIGVFAMQVAMTEAFKMKLSIEEADAIFGRPMGIPKTGVFGLYDLIGIDLMADVLKSFIKELSENDPFQEVAKEIPLVKKLIETGYTGRKGKGGFYRMNKTGATKVMEAINLETGEYSVSKKINIGTDKVDLKSLISRDDKFGEYAWSVISKIIKYSSSLVPGITKEFNDIDEAMRLGFNWAKGPFEMLEEIGVENFFSKIDEFKGNEFLEKLSISKDQNFYGSRQKYTEIETLGKVKKKAMSIDGNNSAQVYRFKDYNI